LGETERISSKELRILAAHDRGESTERIATLIGMDVGEVSEILKIALDKRQKLIMEAEKGESVFVYYRPIDDTLNVPQKGTMKVGSQILRLLSEGIYSSPANSIKELISNAFDADATKVEIRFDENELIVKDDGLGMDYADFDEDFTYISRSRKREKGSLTKVYKRPIIGFIGIGFISVSELCDELTITSAKADSELMFEARIDFSFSRRREALEREFYEVSRFELTNFRKKDKGVDPRDHFTQIRMTKLRPYFREMLTDKKPFGSKPMAIDSIMKYLQENGVKSLTNLGTYWQTLLEIAYISPVVYLPNSPVEDISEKEPTLGAVRRTLEAFNFAVVFDGIELKKPIHFPLATSLTTYERHYMVHPFKVSSEVDGRNLAFTGYIYSQHGSIYPKEYNGIIIRIRNVAIGKPDGTLLSYPFLTNLVFRHWIFGEIYVESGLEEAMNIDRSSFKFTHPHYLHLQKFVHSFLEKTVFPYTLHNYYYAKRKRKSKEAEIREMNSLTQMVKSEMGSDFDLEVSPVAMKFPAKVDRGRRKVVLNDTNPVFYYIRKRDRSTWQRLFVLFEIAVDKSGGDVTKLRDEFLRSIRRWVGS